MFVDVVFCREDLVDGCQKCLKKAKREILNHERSFLCFTHSPFNSNNLTHWASTAHILHNPTTRAVSQETWPVLFCRGGCWEFFCHCHLSECLNVQPLQFNVQTIHSFQWRNVLHSQPKLDKFHKGRGEGEERGRKGRGRRWCKAKHQSPNTFTVSSDECRRWPRIHADLKCVFKLYAFYLNRGQWLEISQCWTHFWQNKTGSEGNNVECKKRNQPNLWLKWF